jgi:hypothetical protein
VPSADVIEAVIKQYARKQSTKFVNIAVLEGEQMKLVALLL